MMRDVWGGGGGWFKESVGRKIQNSILVLARLDRASKSIPFHQCCGSANFFFIVQG